jgi:hypothetical protein
MRFLLGGAVVLTVPGICYYDSNLC